MWQVICLKQKNYRCTYTQAWRIKQKEWISLQKSEATKMPEENHKPGSNDGVVRELVPQHLREIADPTMESSQTRCPDGGLPKEPRAVDPNSNYTKCKNISVI